MCPFFRDSDLRSDHRTDLYLLLVEKYYRKPVLDLGSGSGFLERKLKIDTAVDLFDDRATMHADTFIKHDLNICPYPIDMRYGLVVSFGTIHYLVSPESLLAEAARLLQEDGLFLLSFNKSMFVSNRWSEMNDIEIEHSGLTAERLTRLLDRHGFRVVSRHFSTWFNFNQREEIWERLSKSDLFTRLRLALSQHCFGVRRQLNTFFVCAKK